MYRGKMRYRKIFIVAYEVHNTGLYTFLENVFTDEEEAKAVVEKLKRLGIKAKVVTFLEEVGE